MIVKYKRGRIIKSLISSLLCFIILATVLINAKIVSATSSVQYGTVIADGVNLRKEATAASESLYKLYYGHELKVFEKVNDWYSVETNHFNKTIKGWISSKYVRIVGAIPDSNNVEFEKHLDAQGFPESYRPYLRSLHKKYPNWVFNSYKTEYDWNTIVEIQSQPNKNLVQSSSKNSWKDPDSYIISTGKWKESKETNWVDASDEIIKYYLDPRNFLDEVQIFQFLRLSFDEKYHDLNAINGVLKGTFMVDNKYPKYDKFADLFLEVGKKYNTNPSFLAARVRQEVSSNENPEGPYSVIVSGSYTPRSDLIVGEDLKNLFNFYNIGAYAHSGLGALDNGMLYAKGYYYSTEDKTVKKRTQSFLDNYLLPWNTVPKAIEGGAKYISNNYIAVNQDTIYFQKFNMKNGLSKVGTHQYMQNVGVGASEGASLEKGMRDVKSNIPMVFEIPIYNNMPSKPSPQPRSENLPITSLKSLSVEGFSLTPSFSQNLYKYDIIVPSNVDEININATTYAGGQVSNIGKKKLGLGLNTIEIGIINGEAKGSYTLYVYRGDDILPSLPTPTTPTKNIISSTTYKIGENITRVSLNTSVKDFKANIQSDYSIQVLKPNGKENTGNVGNGDTVKIVNSNGESQASYTVVIFGDINGDGNISNVDLVYMKRQILNIEKIDGAKFVAADLNKDGKISNVDLVLMLRHILKLSEISQ